MVSLLVCLIPTTIGALLSAIGIAGMDRLVQRNVLAMSGRAVEAAGDVNTLLLDKTGTITLGNRQASDFVPLAGRDPRAARRRRAAVQPRRRNPRGPLHRGVRQDGVRSAGPHARRAGRTRTGSSSPPTTRMSGVDLENGHLLRKGAASSVARMGARPGRRRARPSSVTRRRHLRRRRHTAGGRPGASTAKADGPRRHPPQGRRQAGHAGTVRRDAPDGHPHGDDHR